MTPPLSNGRLGTMLLLGTETILFASFIGAYLILRKGAPVWPPSGTPILPLNLSVFNTLVLVLSSGVAVGFRRAADRNQPDSARARLCQTFCMGALFLGLQAVEFHRLYARGLTLQTGTYGALFYSLITCHSLHVLGGLVFLALAWSRLERSADAELYWHFITGIWLILFGILYLV